MATSPRSLGWIRDVPPLAVEYASVGQNETALREKIDDLVRAGVRYLWIVRLTGPRRVEVYEEGQLTRTALPGETLSAPDVLQNPVPVEALYDRAVAHKVAFHNLLQREGYQNLDDVRAEGESRAHLDVLARQFERKLKRALTADERATLQTRIASSGVASVSDLVLDASPDALAAWLTTTDAVIPKR